MKLTRIVKFSDGTLAKRRGSNSHVKGYKDVIAIKPETLTDDRLQELYHREIGNKHFSEGRIQALLEEITRRKQENPKPKKFKW